MLDLPQSTRSPLGNGPTGKDKPKPYHSIVASASASQTFSFASTSRESSAADSPLPRKRSSSPDTLNISVPSRPMQVIESSTSWNGDLMMGNDHHSDVQQSTNSSSLTPMASPLPLKPPYSPYSASLPSSSRNSLTSDIYISNNPIQSHSSDRSLSQSYSEQSFTLRHSEMHEESPREYPYTPSFHPYDHTGMHSQSPSPGVTVLQSQNRHHQLQHQEPSGHYSCSQRQRRMTIPPGFQVGPGYVNIHPTQIQIHSTRQVEFVQGQNEVGRLTPSRHNVYSLDGRLNHQPLP